MPPRSVSRRDLLLWGLVCGSMLLWGGAARAQSPAPPNFIVLIADDMAWDDCGAYGHPHIRTPGLDRMAREGMRFDNAFLTCSSCSPSRSSIITGRYPHNTGAHQLHLPLPAEQVTVAQRLKQQGYYTAASGKWHMGPSAKSGFDKVDERMNQWVETLRQRPQDRPFFLWLAFSDPHRPYQKNTIPQPHTASDAVVPPYLPDVEEVREDLAAYYDEIARLDGVVGEVLDELQRQQIAENTLVVFMSDNGRPFPRCKTTVYDSGIKTPFLAWWPGRVEPGTVTQSLVSSIDLVPTLLELAGATAGTTFSFLPILDDPGARTRDAVFAEHNWHDYEDHGRAVRTERWKYIRNAYPDVPGLPPADAVRSPTYAVMQRMRDAGTLPPEQMGCFVLPRPAEELYDLEADPHELHNLAGDAGSADTLRKMAALLDEWQIWTGDAVPQQRRPDEFDRETGERLRQR